MKYITILLAAILVTPYAFAEQPTIESLALRVAALERQVEALKIELAAANPDKQDEEVGDDRSRGELVINLLSDGQIRVEGLDLEHEDLIARLRPIITKFPNQRLIIRAAGDVRYEEVVRVIESCQKAGGWNLVFAIAKP